MTLNIVLRQRSGKGIGGFVFTGQSNHRRLRPQCGDVKSDVAGTAGTLFDPTDLDHRHRGFG